MISRTPKPRGPMRTAGVLAASAALTAASFAFPAVSAHAAVGDLNCTAEGALAFVPPLTSNAGVKVNASAELSKCASANGSRITSGTAGATGSATAGSGAPCALLFTASGTGTYNWNTGEKSRFSFTVNTDPTKGTVTLSAKVTSGPFKGDMSTFAGAATPNADCAGKGLSKLTVRGTDLFA
ncbi:hypothetical protein AQI88_25600 [Streptomyces cellostaticus]|uniref:Ig-like domain-containing protein n=1 Tax=Streptomyces cellostaticus TaxID=67285 RepID=A0A101NI69_9ACTN|nr:hypothetical protein [Streptomyces cellostaticus]KUM93778.1 hypothetical protein AQI88_25600 [Streptomyces cellostaticus]GHI07695.1 hypothetical protein Scel_60160 [Streptomyces cellostaticus]